MLPSKYHADWQNRRISFMLGLYGSDFFRNKKILELGSYNGYIGNYFAETCNSIVTSVEGRQENVDAIKVDYPLVEAVCADLDTPDWDFGEYDIIINYGLYYHLQHYHKQHLVNCIQNCDFMFFETVIFDSFESEISFNSESGDDQSLSGVGGTPSTSYVENIFKENNCNFVKYCDRRLGYKYDWPDANTKDHCGFHRRLWTVDMIGDKRSHVNLHFERETTALSTLLNVPSLKMVDADHRLTDEEWNQLIEFVRFNKHEFNSDPVEFEFWNNIIQKLYEYQETEYNG